MTASAAASDAASPVRLALLSVAASIFLALLKLSGATRSGSLALLGSALDAGLDIAVTGVTYFVVRMAARPADDDHHFGYLRLESLATLMQTLVLFGVGGFVVHSAARQLLMGGMTMRMAQTPLATATLVVSALVDFWRYRALARAARGAKSAALAASSLSFQLDFLTTVVALIGLLTVGTGWQVADPIAAVVIGSIMLISAVRVLRDTLYGMTDRAPDGVADLARRVAGAVPGVERVASLRARALGEHTFVEVTILVDGRISLHDAQRVKDRVRDAVSDALDGAQCLVVAEPG